MQYKFSRSEKEVIRQISLLAGISESQVKKVFEGIIYFGVLSYLEKEPVSIPFFGDLDITYVKDIMTKKGREAELDFSFKPSSLLVRTIGQIEDKEESDIEKMLKKNIHSKLENLLKEN